MPPPPTYAPFAIFSTFYPLPVKLKCNVIQQNWSVTVQALKITTRTTSSEQYLKWSSPSNNCPCFVQKRNNRPPGYYSRKYGIRVCITLADPGEGPGGQASLIFRPNWEPKGRKTFVWRPGPPYLRVWIRQCIRKSVSSFLSGPRAHLWPFYEPISIRFLFSIMILKFLFLKPEN